LLKIASTRDQAGIQEAVMNLMMTIGAGLVVLGMAGSATACLQSESFAPGQSQERPTGQTDTQSAAGGSRLGLVLAPLSGLSLAAGVILMGIGIGNWKRPIPSEARPANPWSDQPGEHGDPPKGLV
jgi:hypothetical protein